MSTPQPIARPRRRISALFVVATLLLGLGALALAVLIVISGGPVESAIAFVLAAVPLPVLVLLCLWLDRYEPEPVRYLVAAVVWGAVVAVAVGVGLSVAGSALTGHDDSVDAVFWAPVTEELGKGLFLIVIMLVRRHQIHGILDGIVYGGLVGVGFSFTEDTLYYVSSLNTGGIADTGWLFVVRGLAGAFGHSLYTAVFGIGIGVALQTRSTLVRFTAPLLGYIGAMFLHGLWNGTLTFGGAEAFLIAYLVAIIPALIALIGFAAWIRSRERRMLQASLTDCAQRGWIHPAEIPWVSSLRHRRQARTFARAQGGKQAERIVEDYQQTLTEMAFLHHRVMRERPPKDATARMGEILNRAMGYRPYLILPPPLPTNTLMPPH